MQIADLFQFAMNSRLQIGKSWHCFRTYTEDKLPIWGFDPNTNGLFWLAGFGGLGMSTSFGATFDASQALQNKAVNVTDDFLATNSRVRKWNANKQVSL